MGVLAGYYCSYRQVEETNEGYRAMSNRPVIMTVERSDDYDTGRDIVPGANLRVTRLRHMNAVEYLWHRIKTLITPLKTTPVNSNTMTKTGVLDLRVGIEMSPLLWHNLISSTGRESVAWNWLNKYNRVLLSPVPPSDVPAWGACEEAVEV